MSSPSNSENRFPDISDVMILLCAMKKQNEEILTKLNSIEDDNRKLRQELHEIKSSLKHNHNGDSLSSRKRNQSEDETEHENEHSNIKKARVSVSVASLQPESEPEPDGHVVELPASFDSLDDDCLGNVLDFVGKKCYSAFGRVDKRCNEMFCSKGLPKETYLFGYGPLHIIRQKEGWSYSDIARGVLHFNRRDIFDWMFIDECDDDHERLKCLCLEAMKESRLDILREVFQRANLRQLTILRGCDNVSDLCAEAAVYGKLECLKLLRENECEWDKGTWLLAKDFGQKHILEYLRNKGFPTKWEVDSLSEFDY